ncbi:MAG: PIN domain-containing protein [Nitrospiraceae bacterium]|nr:PIN domain-containing protein [Nitrospiraceae bacterium]
MNAVFVDTSAIVALFDRSDERHAEAKALMEIVRRNRLKLILTDYIFDECLTTALANTGHEIAVKVGEFILNSSVTSIIWLDEPLKMKAWDYFKRYSDKRYSFTDCTSFLLMKEKKLNYFFAFDEDFTKAGFMDFSKRFR